MQIIELRLSHFDLYSPVNGEPIANEDIGFNVDAKSLVGYWMDEVMNEPFIKNNEFASKWEERIAEKEEELEDYLDYYEALETFLKEYSCPTWIVFKITTGTEAGGPGDETVWFVIDMQARTEQNANED
jgi:hypothetical protein